MIRISPEGYPFIFGSLLFTGITAIMFLWRWKTADSPLMLSLLLLFCFSLVLTLFTAFFFRDPDRKVPEGKGLFVSPADGKVILIRDIYEKDYLKSESKQVSIFMSLLDVHVNRAPCDGRVSVVRYSPGKFIAAYKDDASLKNENIAMVLESENGKVFVRQVAGFIARRAVCRAHVGDFVKRGERYGIIKFGSRLDVYLPGDARIMVKEGDKAKAGETVIAVK
jgi:phosphatidylserine decarboxylase